MKYYMFVCKFFLYDLCQYKTDTAIMRNYLLIMALQSQHALPSIFRTDTSMSTDGRYTCITTHLLPIERSDWSKQEDKFFAGALAVKLIRRYLSLMAMLWLV